MRWLALDRGSSLPLIRQIYGQISAQILDGDMVAGERLPSTRDAAEELGVSRNVVIEAYDQLAAEGYVLSIEGAGTFVAEGSFLGTRKLGPSAVRAAPGVVAAPDEATPASADSSRQPPLVDFASGRPALDLVPLKDWTRFECAARLEAPPTDRLDYAPPEGRIELRESLARFLRRRRGIECGPEQIVITAGAQQGVSLLARLVVRQGDAVLIEDPCTVSGREVFELAGARIAPVPADEEGLRTDLLPAGASPAAIFVTPSHQFPLGGCLSIQRRIALVNYARAADCLVIEDDYQSEFRYDGPPVSSLQRLDPDRVAYVGTFSKIFFPALRLGYLVAPEPLVDGCRKLKRATDRYGPPAAQLAMARFIDEGRLDRHVARMKKVYRRRRDALVSALESAFPGTVRILGSTTGLHLVAAFEGVAFDPAKVEAIRRAGVGLEAVEDFAIEKGRHLDEAVLGFSHLAEEEIARGVELLAKALR